MNDRGKQGNTRAWKKNEQQQQCDHNNGAWKKNNGTREKKMKSQRGGEESYV